MKRFLSYWLFREKPGEGLSKTKRSLYWCWNVLLLVLGAVMLGVCSLMLAPASYGWTLFWDYWKFPVVIALNLLPPVILALLMYAAAGRTWAALFITALPVLGLSLGNHYKLAFRDDPVIAADLLILQEAGKMAGQYHLYVSRKVGLTVLFAVVWIAALALFARARPGKYLRLGLAGGTLAAALSLVPVYGSTDTYNQIENFEHISRWSQTQVYISKGFIYPFLHSIKDAMPSPPEGYSEKEAAAILAQYRDEDLSDNKINIVGVMLEAFNDFSVFDQIEMQQDLYAFYHALEAESYTGNLVTNIFAGGTVDTERAFLTGMAPSDTNYRSDTSSYVWYLKNQGYATFGDHPCLQWFYNRVNVNSYLGFDWYRFTENHYAELTNGADTAYDNMFFKELTAAAADEIVWGDGSPIFSFSVSYQGHGPYSGDTCWWGGGEVDNIVANYDLQQSDRTILANYLGSVNSTQYYLSEMVEVWRTSTAPIVVVAFGDHKPWLGNGNSVYNALGIDLSGMDKESFYNCWSTRYLIWANDAAKEVIGHGVVGEGPDVSPCFLMNVLFDQLGWKGDAYMQAVDECWREVPVIHNGGLYVTADGELKTFSGLTQEQAALVQRFRNLEYYRLRHYST